MVSGKDLYNSMKGLLLLLCTGLASALPADPAAPTLVTFKNGDMELHGFIYKPAGSGPFPAVLWNHGSEKKPGWAPDLAKSFLEHGFVFFIPHRHGQGRSPGEYIGDLVDQAPPEQRNRAMVQLQETYNEDVAAAVAFLKKQPYVDPNRIVMSGVSYGGIQTLLSAEKGLAVEGLHPLRPRRHVLAAKPRDTQSAHPGDPGDQGAAVPGVPGGERLQPRTEPDSGPGGRQAFFGSPA